MRWWRVGPSDANGKVRVEVYANDLCPGQVRMLRRDLKKAMRKADRG